MPEIAGITVLEPAQAPAQGYIAFVHGVLGSGMNWRAFARKLSERSPGWGALLVDLPLHGTLRDAAVPSPNTIERMGEELAERLQAGAWPIAGLAGHSFGGKVAILAAAQLPADRPRTLWVLDSPPGARPEGRGSASTLRVLRTLERLAPSFASRAEFIHAVIAEEIDRSVAQWLATNLRARPDGRFRFAIDLVAVQDVLEDFFARDLWPHVDRLSDQENWNIDLIYAGRASIFDEAQESMLKARQGQGRLRAHCIPDAGHWLHVDAPAALLDRMLDLG